MKLVFLFDPYRAMTEMLKSVTRYDQEIVDYLVKERLDYFDMTRSISGILRSTACLSMNT